jgi:hypothetical protein
MFETLNRHAISSVPKLLALIWSCGAYRVDPKSPPYVGHCPSAVCALAACAATQQPRTLSAREKPARILILPPD